MLSLEGRGNHDSGGNFMKKRKSDWNMPVGKLKRVRDFLPPPEELVMPETTVKVTISLSRMSVEFFKHQARKYHTKYQKMIREILDQYAGRFQGT